MSKELSIEIREALDEFRKTGLSKRRAFNYGTEYWRYVQLICTKTLIRILLLGGVGVVFLSVWKPGGLKAIIIISMLFITYIITDIHILLQKTYRAQEGTMIRMAREEQEIREEISENP